VAVPDPRLRPVSGGAGSVSEAIARPAAVRGTVPRDSVATRLLEDERVLGVLLLVPTIVLLGLFIAYPFVKGVWLSLTSATVGNPGLFIGFRNFVKIWNDSIFQQATYNTFVYTGIATVFKLGLGMWLALLLNRHFRGKRLVRASMLLPFIIPTVLSTFAWKWMFDPTFSVLNWSLYFPGRAISSLSKFAAVVLVACLAGWLLVAVVRRLSGRDDLRLATPLALVGLAVVALLLTQVTLDGFRVIQTRIGWLTDPAMALGAVIIVNVWRGMPFYAITLLAGLQTVNPELHEAAAIDGANTWQRFWRITWPLLLPVTTVVTLFSVIQTFADFQLVYVLTGGGPANATHLFATYAYQIGIGTGLLGEGAAASLAIFPILFVIVVVQLWYIRRVEGA
jgi:multiple sugar transport system permease protein